MAERSISRANALRIFGGAEAVVGIVAAKATIDELLATGLPPIIEIEVLALHVAIGIVATSDGVSNLVSGEEFGFILRAWRLLSRDPERRRQITATLYEMNDPKVRDSRIPINLPRLRFPFRFWGQDPTT